MLSGAGSGAAPRPRAGCCASASRPARACCRARTAADSSGPSGVRPTRATRSSSDASARFGGASAPSVDARLHEHESLGSRPVLHWTGCGLARRRASHGERVCGISRMTMTPTRCTMIESRIRLRATKSRSRPAGCRAGNPRNRSTSGTYSSISVGRPGSGRTLDSGDLASRHRPYGRIEIDDAEGQRAGMNRRETLTVSELSRIRRATRTRRPTRAGSRRPRCASRPAGRCRAGPG